MGGGGGVGQTPVVFSALCITSSMWASLSGLLHLPFAQSPALAYVDSMRLGSVQCPVACVPERLDGQNLRVGGCRESS
jgi:hypothetical protein